MNDKTPDIFIKNGVSHVICNNICLNSYQSGNFLAA